MRQQLRMWWKQAALTQRYRQLPSPIAMTAGLAIGPALVIPTVFKIAQSSGGSVNLSHIGVGIALGLTLGIIMGGAMQFHHARPRNNSTPVPVPQPATTRRTVRSNRPHLPTWIIGALMIITMIPVAQIGRRAYRESTTAAWTPTNATITETTITPAKHDRVHFVAHYAWESHGIIKHGARYDAGTSARISPEEAQQRHAVFPVGSTQTIYVNPAAPSRAVLVPSVSAKTRDAMIKMSILTIALQAMLTVFLRTSRRRHGTVRLCCVRRGVTTHLLRVAERLRTNNDLYPRLDVIPAKRWTHSQL